MKKKKIKNVSINARLIYHLNLIRNNAFCSYTLPRARRLLIRIKDQLTDKEYETINSYIDNIDIENPDVWQPEWARKGDYKSHLMYVRTEFSRYMNQLINEKKAGELEVC